MDVNRQNLERIRERFSRLFYEVLHSNNNQGRDFVRRLGRIIPSDASRETYSWMVRTGGLEKFEGERQLNRFQSFDLSIEADEWEDSLEVDLRDIERDRLGLYAPGVASMSEDVAWHYAVLFTELLEKGFSSEIYSGKSLFDTNHESHGSGETFSNYTDLELSVEAFRAMRLAPTKIVDRNGRRAGVKYDTLFVSTENIEKAEELNNDEYIMKDPTDPSLGAVKNPVRGQFDNIVEMEYTSVGNEKKYFATDSSMTQELPPLLLQQVQEAEYSAVTNPNDFQVWSTRKTYHGVTAEHGAGYGLPHAIFGGEGTTPPATF